MLLCRNFTFRGLGGIDEVEDEDSHNKGAEGVQDNVSQAHRGARAASTACWGVCCFTWQRLDVTPAETAGRGGGPL